MPTLTLTNVPDAVMARLRARAEAEHRSPDEEAPHILEDALDAELEERPSFMERHRAFVEKHGPPPFGDDFFEGLRDREAERPTPFVDEEDTS
ncbi:MAG: hypothetical protein AAF624_15585 [Bacteroidota bacterium]